MKTFKSFILEGEPFLKAAFKDVTGRIHVGEKGESHPNLMRRIKNKHGEDGEPDNDGFVNHKGHYLNRHRAMDYAKKHDLVRPDAEHYYDPTELHSDMLK